MRLITEMAVRHEKRRRRGWEHAYARMLFSDGSRETRFFHPVTDERVVVHGDDFAFAGMEVEMRSVQAEMREWYDVEVRADCEMCMQISAPSWDAVLNDQVDGRWTASVLSITRTA